MPCAPIKGDGVGAIVCTRGPAKRCKWCQRPSTKLCDFPVKRNGKAGTCDASMCDRCAVTVPGLGVSLDYCPPHARYSHAA